MNKKRYTQKEVNYVREVAKKMLDSKDKKILELHENVIDKQKDIIYLSEQNEYVGNLTKIYRDAFTRSIKQLKVRDNIILILAIINIILFGLVIKGLL